MWPDLEAWHAARPFLDSEQFKACLGLVVFFNPVALLPQLLNVFMVEVEELKGVSAPMMTIFACIQAALILTAIRVHDLPLFWAMTISLALTTTILAVLISRRLRQWRAMR